MPLNLFHDDTEAFYDLVGLRAHASAEIAGSPLIRAAASGKCEAAIALHIGFWPFVREFELAIDRQKLPREPLSKKFGRSVAKETFVGLSRAVREMKTEEGSHAAHWRKDAACLGIETLEGPLLPGAEALIESSYTTDLPKFFAVLAGTEFIAEELGRFLTASDRFTNLFSRKRWVWGDVHLIPHDDGPSHLHIDLDLARAYSSADRAADIETHILDTIALFGKAAADVERYYPIADSAPACPVVGPVL